MFWEFVCLCKYCSTQGTRRDSGSIEVKNVLDDLKNNTKANCGGSWRAPPSWPNLCRGAWYRFLFKWRITRRRFWFFQMAIFTTLFRRCWTFWYSKLKIKKWFRSCLTLLISTLNHIMLIRVGQCCKLQHWHAQCCFNNDLTLPDVAASYEP